MGIKVTNNIPSAKGMVRRHSAYTMNAAALEHVAESRTSAPVDTRFMRDHISQTQEATEARPEAVVESEADYSAAVNYGHHTASGSFVPAQPFWEPGEEAGRNEILRHTKALGEV